jgi:hypothetical protein
MQTVSSGKTRVCSNPCSCSTCSILEQISSLAFTYTTHNMRGPMFIQYGGTLEEATCLCAENHLLQWLLIFLHLSFPNLLYRAVSFPLFPSTLYVNIGQCSPGLHTFMFLNFIFSHLVWPFGWASANHGGITCAAHRHKKKAHIQAVGKIQTHNHNV